MEEIWKAIPDYEGIYEASTYGNIKSLSRRMNDENRIIISKEIILKQSLDVHGRYTVALYKDKARKTKRVHKLVAITFLNHTPDGTQKLVVDHIDNNKLNNRSDNLQLITNRENSSKDKIGLYSSSFTGASYHKPTGKWKSSINDNGKKMHLGTFTTEIEASNAYKLALERISNGLNVIKIEYTYSSKYKGVRWSKAKNRWITSIYVNKKSIHLGIFRDEEEASRVYQKALLDKIASKTT